MSSRPRVMGAMVLLATFPLMSNQSKLAKLEQDFETQKDAVHRAKALAKLLPMEIDQAAAEIRSGDDAAGFARLDHYRDEARLVHNALLAAVANPVKHSAGFVQLQIALRESMRRLGDLIFLLPLENRKPAEAVRVDLAQLNGQMLEELFPPPPPPRPGKEKH